MSKMKLEGLKSCGGEASLMRGMISEIVGEMRLVRDKLARPSLSHLEMREPSVSTSG